LVPQIWVAGSSGNMPFFQFMARRYETVSTVLTSTKGFDEWARSLAMRHGTLNQDTVAAVGRRRHGEARHPPLSGVRFSITRSVRFSPPFIAPD